MLTDAKVKTLKIKEKLYRILDSERLYIEVRPTGKKIWRFKFTLHRKEGTLSFGEYPAVSLQEARKLREDAQAKLAKGLNPAHEKKKEKINSAAMQNNNFKNVAEEYVLEQMKYKSADYVKRFQYCLGRDVFPVIGHTPINEVSSAQVLYIMRSTVERVRKHSGRGSGEAAANLNRRFIGLVMRYAIVTLRADNDPTYALKNAIERPETEHARPLSKNEKVELRKKLEEYGGTTTVRNAALMMLYSMLRTAEVRKMEWSFVDFDELTITFPRSSRGSNQERVMKKNRVHIVPITTQILKILKQQQHITFDQKYVFSSPQKRSCMLSPTTLNKLLQYIGLNDVTSHDFRATASTDLNSLNYDSDWIEKQLAHSDDNKTRASYNHAQYLDDRRKMLQDWANIVDSWGE